MEMPRLEVSLLGSFQVTREALPVAVTSARMAEKPPGCR